MAIIEVHDLERSFGDLKAVNGISFEVGEGEIFGFLGPNGAGKSTTIKILVTLLKHHRGTIRINGLDINTEQAGVRRSVGIIFQDPSLDERLTAYENLYFHARLYHVPTTSIQERIDHVLDIVDLGDRRNDLVMNFSGGMKRRLEIARGMLHTPQILFLDEPTIGLDPQTRRYIWQYLLELREKQQITIFLTTHYMEEAEICDRIAIIDHGEIIALDSPAELKRQIGGDVITVSTNDNDAARSVIKERLDLEAIVAQDGLKLLAADGSTFLPQLFEALGSCIIGIDIKKPSLEDVFIKLTGREIRDADASNIDRLRNRIKRRGRQ